MGLVFASLVFQAKERTHAGDDPGRAPHSLTSNFQKAENQDESGQTTRKKKKGKSREPQLALQISYQIGSLWQALFLVLQHGQMGDF